MENGGLEAAGKSEKSLQPKGKYSLLSNHLSIIDVNPWTGYFPNNPTKLRLV
jgi:hypothetical protein